MHSKLVHLGAEEGPLMKSFRETEYLEGSNGTAVTGFRFQKWELREGEWNGMPGRQYLISGTNRIGVEKVLLIRILEPFPGLATFQVSYSNQGDQTLDIAAWVNHDYLLEGYGEDPAFWTFQGSSTSERADWIRPLEGFYQNNNYMGMNNSDYGGGIPVTDIWRKDAGIAIGHVETVQKLVSLPVLKERQSNQVQISLNFSLRENRVFKPGDRIESIETFVMAHEGDCFQGLRTYSELMQGKGISFPPSEPSAFESMWCAWGYERNFTAEEVIGTLPKVRELGIKWATLDDGYQITEGDWTANPEKFPGGDEEIRNITQAIHDHGLKAQIWWAPLAVSPDSRLLAEHPGILLRTDEWAPQYITWWDAWYMAPTDSVVLAHTKEVVKMFIRDWDFDGIKLDGQHLNGVEPDYADGHGLSYPEEAVERLPEFFDLIYETARAIKPAALLQHCPCGTCMSFYNMPTTNQFVSSDPTSSRQIRQKGKVYKAIAPQTAYFGDHVELSDQGEDFASSFGIGAVLGTKFTWPKDNPTVETSYLLTPEKEQKWKKWFGLYHQKMLSREKYLGSLYDIGFDKPEAHVIQKSDTLFYAFYADNWQGPIELRGLDTTLHYRVQDYVNDLDLGPVSGSSALLEARFDQHMLLMAYPEKNGSE